LQHYFLDVLLECALNFLKLVNADIDVTLHDALGDAMATLHLFKWLFYKYPYHVGRLLSEGGNYVFCPKEKTDESVPVTNKSNNTNRKLVAQTKLNPLSEIDDDD
jgi:hypothetical protein